MDNVSTGSIAYFDRIPDELVILIFSFLAYSMRWLRLPPGKNDDRRPLPHPLFVVRWVSRRFRTIASDLDFWQVWELPNICQELSILDLHPLVQARRIKNLLLDDALARRLHRKTAWRFSSIDVFYAIVTGVPEVFQHTNRLQFENFADGLGIAVGRLGMFSSLISLNISVPPPMEEVDLGMIAASCPLLNFLAIQDLQDYRGSLEHAANLRNLRIEFYQHETFQALLLPNLIPTRSAETLRSFNITFGLFDDDNFALLALTTFLKLKTLVIDPLIPQLCDLIRHGGFTLTNLEIEFSQPIPGLELADLLAILSAPCVRFLRVLKFKLDSDRDDRLIDTDEEEWTDAIISEMLKLQYLDCLVLMMGLRMTWCERFAALKNLTILHYDYFHYDDLGLESPITETFEQIAKESQARVGNQFDEAFAGFVSKPFVALRMLRYHM
jgi:hypothetical protein